MGRKRTYKEVKEFIEGFGCELLSDKYDGNKTKLLIKCSCGEIFERTFNGFQKRQNCKYCSGNNLSYEYVDKFISDHKCKLLSKTYKNNSAKLDIQCSCGELFSVSFNKFKAGQQQCKKCGMKNRTEKRIMSTNSKTEYYSYEKIKNIIDNNSTAKLISKEYKGCFESLELKCKCGNNFKQAFNHIKQKLNNNQDLLCPSCMKKISDESFRLSENEINEKIFNKYKYQKFSIYDYENYINANSKNKFIHNECGHIFECTLSSLLQFGRLCPKCERKHSKGVYSIMHYLNENNIEYVQEKTFNDCKYERKLPFDFYLPKYNCCIEYDGEQHSKSTSLYGGEKNFKKIRKRDEIKNDYCSKNNIPLLRISYKNNDFIDEIINNFINMLIPR